MNDLRYIENIAILKLNRDACVGCGLCVTVCPHRVFALQNGKAEIVDFGGCMECGACSRNCPTEAIFVNPDDGCGCAALIINRWLARITGKTPSGCGC